MLSHCSLPLAGSWACEDDYVKSLLSFCTVSDLFRNLCGGIHILDFLTREPDLYTTVLPEDWRKWFELVSIDELLDLLLREDLDVFSCRFADDGVAQWRGVALPPASLIDYVGMIRKHCLLRNYEYAGEKRPAMSRNVAVGMKPKKIHEVSEFAAYIDKLSDCVASQLPDAQQPTIVDFGSGQNYLGRILASPPYQKHVIAIERKHHNIDGAKGMDVHAKLTKKEKIMRNKKEYKRQLAEGSIGGEPGGPDRTPVSVPEDFSAIPGLATHDQDDAILRSERGSMTYVEHEIEDGQLEDILYPSESEHTTDSESSSTTSGPRISPDSTRPPLLVVSLHSCGNLIHHGLRSVTLNPSVQAVAMIGCCYNLMTERLGPVTYKLPQLRPNHPRLISTSTAYDAHGFPMSKTLEDYTYSTPNGEERGVRLNITARMMAVQAPYNWSKEDSDAFFRRHFYRALLQRILLDRGVVKQNSNQDGIVGGSISGKSLSGIDEQGTPLIVGSLPKHCFTSFKAYVRRALDKLAAEPELGPMIRSLISDLRDETIDQYESDWGYAKKHLAMIWSLMAFSAGVVESVIAVDRWLFLKEQDCIEKSWVEPVFDYKQSPRNLVVVGIKKQER